MTMDQTKTKVFNNRIQSGISQGKQSQVNLSGLNNSKRNVSLGSAGFFQGSGRPKTAAMGGGGLPRPPTAFQNNLKTRFPNGLFA